MKLFLTYKIKMKFYHKIYIKSNKILKKYNYNKKIHKN